MENNDDKKISKERFNYKLVWVNFILAFCIVIIHVINYQPRINSNVNVEVVLKMIGHISGIGVSCFFLDIRFFILL